MLPSSGSPPKIMISPRSTTSHFPLAANSATLTYAAELPNHQSRRPHRVSTIPSRRSSSGRELLGPSDATNALAAAYQPGRTFAQAFADFYSAIFAAQGLLFLDAAGREFHRLGAPVLRAAIERADEFHAALIERSQRS